MAFRVSPTYAGVGAWVDALKLPAELEGRAVPVLYTLSTVASCQWVSVVAVRTPAHRPPILFLAIGVFSTGIAVAGVDRERFWCISELREGSGALSLGVASVTWWTFANRFMVPGVTISVQAARSSLAHAHAFPVPTPVVVRALFVFDALRLAALDGSRFGDIAFKTPAAGSVVSCDLTERVGPAWRRRTWVCPRPLEAVISESSLSECAHSLSGLVLSARHASQHSQCNQYEPHLAF